MNPSTQITTALAGIKALCEKATHEGSRDWREDFSHENGNYHCHCANCGNIFTGHKRRVQCKLCYTIAASRKTITRLVKVLEYEMKTAKELALDSFAWAMRYEITKQEYLEQSQSEIAVILTSDMP